MGGSAGTPRVNKRHRWLCCNQTHTTRRSGDIAGSTSRSGDCAATKTQHNKDGAGILRNKQRCPHEEVGRGTKSTYDTSGGVSDIRDGGVAPQALTDGACTRPQPATQKWRSTQALHTVTCRHQDDRATLRSITFPPPPQQRTWAKSWYGRCTLPRGTPRPPSQGRTVLGCR